VDELKDVVPITEDLGLWHPQEGIVRGHLKANEGQYIAIIGQLRQGVSKVVEDYNYTPSPEARLAVADLITGYGVAESVIHFYDLYKNTDVKGKRVIVQGWGNVASAAAYYLAKQGAKIVGILDLAGGIIREEGLSFEEVRDLYLHKNGNKISAPNLLSFEETNQRIWNVAADIFIPGAASKIVSRANVDALLANNIEVISAGANVPFVDDTVFFGETAAYTDTKTALIPDFIANSGMARVFAYLMQPNVLLTDRAIFSDVSQVIRKGLEAVKAVNPESTGLSSSALTIALEKLI
jgi:glutamate dehydrogenase/leucine dehydrogenase